MIFPIKTWLSDFKELINQSKMNARVHSLTDIKKNKPASNSLKRNKIKNRFHALLNRAVKLSLTQKTEMTS
jgi:hypothetical protein